MKHLVEFETSELYNLIYKVRPYIYGDKNNIHDPDCEVQIKADIWCTNGRYVPRADVDVVARTITKSGPLKDRYGLIDPPNIEYAIQEIERIIKEQKGHIIKRTASGLRL